MESKINLILKEVLEKVNPLQKDLKEIKERLNEFKMQLKKEIKKFGLDTEIFEGGSFAKNTIIKKDVYDVDVFLRFNEKYRGKNISKLTEKLLRKFKFVSLIHGSRDYFRIRINGNFFIELIPVIKINFPKKAENITDLSYSHVRYINKKIKNKSILNDIKIAKAFCYATGTYGAESHIHGFSGYSLELLVYYYKGFLNFIKAMAKHKKGKLIIDIEKHYKNKNDVLLDINTSKLDSPVILIDPTYKQRNALAALSEETFEKFRNLCGRFLKNPSIKDFEVRKFDLENIKADALKSKYEFILLEAKTSKQEGAVAGSKLLKFYTHLEFEIRRFFEIKNKGFNYNNKKSAKYFFVVKKKPEIIFEGPFLKDLQNTDFFKKQHKSTFSKSGKIYAKEKVNFNLNDFIQNWKLKYKKKIKEMDIIDLRIV